MKETMSPKFIRYYYHDARGTSCSILDLPIYTSLTQTKKKSFHENIEAQAIELLKNTYYPYGELWTSFLPRFVYVNHETNEMYLEPIDNIQVYFEIRYHPIAVCLYDIRKAF